MRISGTKAVWLSCPLPMWVCLFLAGALLTVPLSSTAKSFFIGMVVVLIVFAPAYRRDLLMMLSKPWCQAALLFFFVALMESIWSSARPDDIMLVLEKYSKILYLPVLAVGFRDKNARRVGIHAFLLAMVVTGVISILKFTSLVTYHGEDPGAVFRNHIMTGYMVAFATYLSGLLFVQERGKVRLVYALLVLLFSYQMLFISTGRTGYVIYLLLMILLMIQTLPWRQAIIAIMLICSLFTVNCFRSPSMQYGINNAISDWKLYKENSKDTSIGYRLQFHQYAYRLFKRHSWLGNGTGSFMYSFREENPIPSKGRKLLEPHSQYWLVAAEFGLLGLCVLAIFFGSLFFACLQLKQMRSLAIAVFLPFILGNLSDSFLFYSGSGYFFILFMGLCLGEHVEKQS